MTDSLREMASALIDGEASELECRRLLRESEHNQVRELIRRHYTVRAVMRRECSAVCPPELNLRILAALDAETGLGGRSGQRWLRPLAGLAVAASVCAAVVLGNQSLGTIGSNGPQAVPTQGLVAMRGTTLPALGSPAKPAGLYSSAVVPVGFSSAGGREVQATGSETNGLAAQRLQRFMLEHAENAALNSNQGMMPFARVARYDLP